MIRRYRIVVETDNTGWVKVKVPAIPGIHAEAHTREQALQFAHTAVESHLTSLAAFHQPIPDSDTDAIVVEV